MPRPVTVTLLALFYAATAPLYAWSLVAGDDPRGRVLYPAAMCALAALASPGLWRMTRWGWLAAVTHEAMRLFDLVRDGTTRVVTGAWPQYAPEDLQRVAGMVNLPIDLDAAVWLPMLISTSGATFVLTYLSSERRRFFPVRAELVPRPPG